MSEMEIRRPLHEGNPRNRHYKIQFSKRDTPEDTWTYEGRVFASEHEAQLFACNNDDLLHVFSDEQPEGFYVEEMAHWRAVNDALTDEQYAAFTPEEHTQFQEENLRKEALFSNIQHYFLPTEDALK